MHVRSASGRIAGFNITRNVGGPKKWTGAGETGAAAVVASLSELGKSKLFYCANTVR